MTRLPHRPWGRAAARDPKPVDFETETFDVSSSEYAGAAEGTLRGLRDTGMRSLRISEVMGSLGSCP